MPRTPLDNNDRMAFRIDQEEKSLLMRAAALQHTNLTERDSLKVLNLLDRQPIPNDKLMAAAFALPKKSRL